MNNAPVMDRRKTLADELLDQMEVVSRRSEMVAEEICTRLAPYSREGDEPSAMPQENLENTPKFFAAAIMRLMTIRESLDSIERALSRSEL